MMMVPGDGGGGGDGAFDPSDGPWAPTAAMNPEMVLWRERERRQRTIRLLMMFLVMLLLMDGEEGNGGRRGRPNGLRKNLEYKLEPAVFSARCAQEQRIRSLVQRHPRYAALASKNAGTNVDETVTRWAQQRAEQEKDQFAEAAVVTTVSQRMLPATENRDPEEDRKVFHYPWNATGFYRGEWVRTSLMVAEEATQSSSTLDATKEKITKEPVVVDARALEEIMLPLPGRDNLGVRILPDGYKLLMRDDNNLTSLKWEDLRTDANNAIVRAEPELLGERSASITLEHDSGRVAFQFFSRSIPSMQELSLVDGFVKLYDSTSPGYSTRKDILLRVRGVLIHSIGSLSLVSTNVDVSRSALVLGEVHERRRRLEDALRNLDQANIETIREDAEALFAGSSELGEPRLLASSSTSVDSPAETDGEKLESTEEEKEVVNQQDMPDSSSSQNDWDVGRDQDQELPESSNPDKLDETQQEEPEPLAVSSQNNETAGQQPLEKRRALASVEPEPGMRGLTQVADVKNASQASTKKPIPPWSDIVIPYPFVRDDSKETIRRTKTPAARMMPPREQALEANSAGCGFEINLEVGEIEWTVGNWRKLISNRVNERKRLDPTIKGDDRAGEDETILNLRGSRPKPIQDQALVMTLVGTIVSLNCDFKAALNVTALRTDWETTTSKAINYSFVMMLVCLTQILVLLRQLLHSQGQSTATRVSLLCIGWQTLLDALLCLGHIYLSLSIQPLFSAIASVSFFKLLIFCVIEMKYMAIIIQARNSSNGGQTTEVLRRQIAMLHLRFYTALAGTFLLLFYVGEKYRIFYVLALYSFWVPQIILNVVTEAKMPMHTYYIYGMSLTRLVAPLYMFAVKRNFLREVYPEAPYDPFTYQMLVVWMGIQTAVLIGQSKYGARFMIPARFLPPKFDYSRPIPASMLPPGALDLPVVELSDDRDDSSKRLTEEREAVAVGSTPRHKTAITTRNRIRGKNRAPRTETGMIDDRSSNNTNTNGTQTTSSLSIATAHNTLDCSICYEPIDVRKRHDYMLAPCNHLFHRECLVQWMDVKMECPICRLELPAL